jgi:hypothetical protein
MMNNEKLCTENIQVEPLIDCWYIIAERLFGEKGNPVGIGGSF